jgi:hypothetical protein
LQSQLLRRQRSGGSQFEASPHKKLPRTQLNKKKLGTVVHACHAGSVRVSQSRMAQAKKKIYKTLPKKKLN